VAYERASLLKQAEEGGPWKFCRSSSRSTLLVGFYEAHLTPWTTHAAAIALAPANVTALGTIIAAASAESSWARRGGGVEQFVCRR